eukprot:EC852153.1.p1 GENE.EC852153.1~~EC852153.1.p1  ORF type:complete len:181 (+),score=19.40 EC852153.1:57-599(+)
MSLASNGERKLAPAENDIQSLLACHCHIGARNCDAGMERYVWNRRSDGVHILHLGRTWEKLMLAARIIVSIENPADVCAVAAGTYGQRAVLKFAHHTGAQSLAGRFTPGTFTNQIQKRFIEPRLLIITNPRMDHQPIWKLRTATSQSLLSAMLTRHSATSMWPSQPTTAASTRSACSTGC